MSRASWRENVELGIKVTGLLGIVLAGTKFFIDRSADRLREAQARSEQQVAIYNSSISEDARAVELYLGPYVAILGPELFAVGKKTDFEAIQLKDIFNDVFIGGSSTNQRKPMLNPWLRVLRYYDAANVCLESRFCDKDYLNLYLCERAEVIYQMSAYFVVYMAENYSGAAALNAPDGSGLRSFVEECKNWESLRKR